MGSGFWGEEQTTRLPCLVDIMSTRKGRSIKKKGRSVEETQNLVVKTFQKEMIKVILKHQMNLGYMSEAMMKLILTKMDASIDNMHD